MTTMNTHQRSTGPLQLPLHQINASTSVISLGKGIQHNVAFLPIPLARAADLARLTEPTLYPFPGLQHLQE